MKFNLRSSLFIPVLIASLLTGMAIERWVANDTRSREASLEAVDGQADHAHRAAYVCPMHPEIQSDQPGKCPICGMDLVPNEHQHAMDEADEGPPVVKVSSAVMGELGVRTEPVVRKSIVRRIDAPGLVQEIKKDRMTHYSAPFDAVVTALLFDKGAWLETGAPLIELKSDDILHAQERHLQLLAGEGGQDGAAAGAPQTDRALEKTPSPNVPAKSDAPDEIAPATTTAAAPVAAPAEDTTSQGAASKAAPEADASTTPGGLTAKDISEIRGFLGANGHLSDEQRRQLEKLGMQPSAIDAMEAQLMADVNTGSGPSEDGAGDNGASEDSASGAAPPTTRGGTGAEKPTGQASGPVPGGGAPMVGNTGSVDIKTLDDSRRYLASIGMRAEDILRLETERKPSDRIRLYAGHPGRVMELKVAKDAFIGKGELMFTLGGLVRAVVVANAFQRDAVWITTGQRAEVRMPHVSGVVYPGIVNQGAVSINTYSQNIGVKVTFSAPFDEVRTNTYVVSTIYGDEHENVLAVPAEALIRTEHQDRVVLALGDGRFKPVVVKTGVEAAGEVEVTDGLKEGDQVVVMAQFLIDSESSLQAAFRRLDSE